MAERQKATDEKAETDESSKSKAARGQGKSQGDLDAAVNKATEEMAEGYFGYLEKLTAIQQKAVERHWDMLREYAVEVGKLQSDIAAADPSAAFLSDVMRAYKNSDPKGVLEAYTSLTKHAAQVQTMSEKRHRDLVKSWAAKAQALAKQATDEVVDEGRDYGKRMLSAMKKIDIDDLDPTSKVALAQALMVSAAVRSKTGADQ